MKTIHFRSFKESFFQLYTSKKNEDTTPGYIWENGFFKTIITGFSQPQVFCLSSVFLLLFFGAHYRLALVLGLTIASWLSLNYLFLRSISEQLALKFDPVPAVTEKQKAQLKFNIENLSQYTYNEFNLNFSFDGSSKPEYQQLISDDIAGCSIYRNSIYLNCDVGMGRYSIKDISICLSGPFNIFQFRVFFETAIEIEVRPKIEEMPMIKTKGSEFSEMYGQHEMQSRGLSVNFSNIRPYSFGDNIRHIAWRPSAKLGSLVVKEFEKMVNTDATLVLNLNPAHHVGYDLTSSWETAKDVTLSLVSHLLNQNSSIEFIYNYGFVEKSNSKDQFYAISKLLVDHNIFEAAEGEHKKRIHIDDPLQQWKHRIQPGSTLFYIGTTNYPYLRDALQLLKWLSREKVEVILVLINPLTAWAEFRQIDPSFEKPSTTSKINQLLTELQETGVRICFADMGDTLQKNFREKPYMSESSTKEKQSANKAFIKS